MADAHLLSLAGLGYEPQLLDDLSRWAQDSPTSATFSFHGTPSTLQRRASQSLQRRASQHLARRNSQRLVARRSFVVQRRPSLSTKTPSSTTNAPVAPSRRPSLHGQEPSFSNGKPLARRRSLSIRVPSFTLYYAHFGEQRARASFCDISVPIDGVALDQYDPGHDQRIAQCIESVCAPGPGFPGFQGFDDSDLLGVDDLPYYDFGPDGKAIVVENNAGGASVEAGVSAPSRLVSIKEENAAEVAAFGDSGDIAQTEAPYEIALGSEAKATPSRAASSSNPSLASTALKKRSRRNGRKRSLSVILPTASPAEIFGIMPNGIYMYPPPMLAPPEKYALPSLDDVAEAFDPYTACEDNAGHADEEDDEEDDTPLYRRRRTRVESDDEYVDDEYVPQTPNRRRAVPPGDSRRPPSTPRRGHHTVFQYSPATPSSSRARQTQPSYRSPQARRPFPCPHPGCEHACINRNDLGRHLLKHGPASWACYGCEQTFTRRDALKRHVEKNGSTASSCRQAHLARAAQLNVEPLDPFPKNAFE